MTYGELSEKIAKMTENQKACDLTIYDETADEYYPAELLTTDDVDDVLDANHPYFKVKD